MVRSQPTRHPTEGLDVWWESSGWDGDFVVEERPPCHLPVDIFMLCSPCREITATPSLRVLPCEGSRPSNWISYSIRLSFSVHLLFNKSTCFIKSVLSVQDPLVFIEGTPKSMKSLRLFGNYRHSFNTNPQQDTGRQVYIQLTLQTRDP